MSETESKLHLAAKEYSISNNGNHEIQRAFRDGARWSTEQQLDQNNLLKKARSALQGWAWLGFNGSPFPDEARQELQSRYQSLAWKQYIEIFGDTP